VSLHDSFVKSCFDSINVSKSFVCNYISDDVRSRIDFTTLKAIDKESVGNDFKQLRSDKIFSCEIDNNSGYLYFLIEHQSRPDKLMALRFLKYTVALLDNHLKRHSDSRNLKLPIIIPLCLYHGKREPYPYAVDIANCFVDPELSEKYLISKFKLIDLTVMSDAECEQHGWCGLMEIILKHNAQESYVDLFKKLVNRRVLQQWVEKDDGCGSQYLSLVLEYVLRVGEHPGDNADDLFNVILKAYPQTEEKVMTMLERYQLKVRKIALAEGEQIGLERGEKRGLEKGNKKGIKEGEIGCKRKMAKRMLRANLEESLILEITGMTAEQLEDMKSAVD